uniref:Uncharacterized protein n=1 Tax=Rhizophora mucronata TaxID=61149 RepID=A0A2P2R0A3_RHIMU
MYYTPVQSNGYDSKAKFGKEERKNLWRWLMKDREHIKFKLLFPHAWNIC